MLQAALSLWQLHQGCFLWGDRVHWGVLTAKGFVGGKSWFQGINAFEQYLCDGAILQPMLCLQVLGYQALGGLYQIARLLLVACIASFSTHMQGPCCSSNAFCCPLYFGRPKVDDLWEWVPR